MKDAHPRIFRQLEKTSGRDGFDMIVNAAVLSYGSLRAPNDTQARDFARLVVPLWSRVTADTRRTLAAGLSHSSRVPREIVERLIAEPIEVSAPFLMSSPALGEAELKALALSPDRRLRKLIAERSRGPRSASVVASATAAPTTAQPKTVGAQPPMPKSDAATARDEESTRRETTTQERVRQNTARRDATHSNASASPLAEDRKAGLDSPSSAEESAFMPSRRPVERLDAPPLVPDLVPAPRPASATASRKVEDAPIASPTAARSAALVVRETLLRLALPGRRKSPADAAAGPAPTLAELVSMAVRQDGARFYDGLVRLLGLSPDMLRGIVLDETGERLAVALKAIGASQADAMTVLMMMKPGIGLDVEAFQGMTRYYRALKAADCTSLARGQNAPAREAPAKTPALQSPYQDTASPQRSEARTTFGRRTTLPSEAGDKRSA